MQSRIRPRAPRRRQRRQRSGAPAAAVSIHLVVDPPTRAPLALPSQIRWEEAPRARPADANVHHRRQRQRVGEGAVVPYQTYFPRSCQYCEPFTIDSQTGECVALNIFTLIKEDVDEQIRQVTETEVCGVSQTAICRLLRFSNRLCHHCRSKTVSRLKPVSQHAISCTANMCTFLKGGSLGPTTASASQNAC